MDNRSVGTITVRAQDLKAGDVFLMVRRTGTTRWVEVAELKLASMEDRVGARIGESYTHWMDRFELVKVQVLP